jgi:lipopolysaccharide/colanic/teichoic acid biosynthesis glycosyltransferase
MKVNNLSVAETGQVDSGHPLVTRVGVILRRLKIDELPQLVNVLKGDISLVGPRPATAEHVRGYDAFQLLRLEMRPGLTGWAQINGNARLTWDERIALDIYYIDHWSLALDMVILFATFPVILRGERLHPAALKRALEHAHCSHRRG